MPKRLSKQGVSWVAVLALVSTGCAETTGDSSPPTSAEQTPSACVAVSQTVLSTDVGVLDLGDATATVKMVVAEDGCAGQVEVELAQDDGCRLHLVISEVQGDWAPVMGQLVTHPDCGAPTEMTYNLNTLASTAGIVQIPVTEGECADGADLALVGLARFVSGEDEITVRLDDVTVDGNLEVAAGDVSCPEATTVTCAGQSCGEDSYGVDCGSCAGEQVCEAGACTDAICPPQGPFGVNAGDTITDLELPDCDGNMHRLHDLCGARAGFVNLLSGG
ncbi:MAG: hypothetical protein VYE15_02760 [Myxococcota bacterium]|nr:hypothetical protein [Myxococcota bacterium]